MIKATIQNSPYCTEMTFPCTETELQEKLVQIGIDKNHLSPTGTVIEIEPAELSVLTDCEVSLDALTISESKCTVWIGWSKNNFWQFCRVMI